MKFKNQSITFESVELPAGTLMVQKLHGEERMSGLFRFELDLLSQDAELDLEKVLYAPVKLSLKVQVNTAAGKIGETDREICGVLETFELREQGQGWVKYHAVLVPKLWQTTRTHRSRVFQDLALEDLITTVLKGNELDPGHDFEFQLQREGADGDPKKRSVYPEREYIVQYEETDWHFMSRWLEDEGVYYYYVNEDGKEKVVFADTESSYAKPTFGETFLYNPEAKGDGGDSSSFADEHVRTFHCRQSRLPRQVRVSDYNWRIVSQLRHSKDVLETGTGVQSTYNNHYKDDEQGKEIAKIRAEELACRATTYHGSGSCRSFRPGATFTLENHFRSDWNRSYLLTRVVHEAEQMISLESAAITGVKYENTFEAITDDQPWRPERVTEWPCITGAMNATIDAEGDGHTPELDEYGRYKLVMPYDDNADDVDDGKASRWVRMAQPYVGRSGGMHFPLRKGTEVLVTHIDGDPDRPIITGAVPNPLMESPANLSHPTDNTIRTTAGNVLQMDDADNRSGFLMMDASRSSISDSRQRRKQGSGATAPATQPAGGNGSPSKDDARQDGEIDDLEDRIDTIEDQDLDSRLTELENDAQAEEDAARESRIDKEGAKDGSDRSLVKSWKAFFDEYVRDENDNPLQDGNGNDIKTAFHELATHGTLFSDQDGNSNSGPTFTSTASSQVALEPDAPGSDNYPLNEKNVVAALNYALSKGAGGATEYISPKNPGSDPPTYDEFGLAKLSESDVSGTELSGRLGDLVQNEANDFLASAKGTRLKLFMDDNVVFSIGDTYKFADGTNEVSIGTGGNSYSEQLGPSNSHSICRAKSTSKSEVYGDSSSDSTTHGVSTSISRTLSRETSGTYGFSGKASLSVTGGGETSNSAQLAVLNSNSMFIGAKADLSLVLAGEAEVKVGAALVLKTSIAPLITEVKLTGEDAGFTTVTSKVELQRKQVALNKTLAELSSGTAHVSKNDNVLATLQNRVTMTQNTMNHNNQVLADNMTALGRNMKAMTDVEMKMSHNQTALADNSLAALHNIA